MDDLERMLRTRLSRSDAGVPETVDEAVLGTGRAAARAFRRRRRLRVVARAAAAAAVAAVVTFAGLRLSGASAREFDVVDAWRVAAGMVREEPRYDLDGDGRVDRADADAMLARIVALGPRRNS